jgi:hypothetical protein
VRIEAFAVAHLPQLLQLVNLHLTAAIPGWALSGVTLARHLERDDSQPVTDPWVAERVTLCAVEAYRVLAAAHLLRYGAEPAVGETYRGTAEIGRLLARPERPDAAATLLAAADDQFGAWGVGEPRGWGSGLPAGPLWGVPDVWPHVADALRGAGYRPDPATHREALYGGWLAAVPLPDRESGLRSRDPSVGRDLRDAPGRHPRGRGGRPRRRPARSHVRWSVARPSRLGLARRSPGPGSLTWSRHRDLARPTRRRLAAPGRLRSGRPGRRRRG